MKVNILGTLMWTIYPNLGCIQTARPQIRFPRPVVWHIIPFSSSFFIMMSRFSNDSSATQLGLVIRISGTMRRSFDRSHPDRKWGDAFPLEYMVVGSNTWLCLGVPAGMVDFETWYYGRDHVWFSLGLPVATWKDAVVLECSVPGRFLVIPDHMFHLPISRKFRFKRLLMGRWLPSVRKVCYFFLFPGGVLTISLFLPRFPAPWGLRIEAGMGYYKWYFIVGLHFVHLLYGKVLLTQGNNIFKQITQTVLRCDTVLVN
jgi:hypothetical protein